jgi:peptide alpha-N-acetyltransferase
LKAKSGDECIGAIVCKLDIHKKMVRRGYIAMLAVDENYRRKGIGERKELHFIYFIVIFLYDRFSIGSSSHKSNDC